MPYTCCYWQGRGVGSLHVPNSCVPVLTAIPISHISNILHPFHQLRAVFYKETPLKTHTKTPQPTTQSPTVRASTAPTPDPSGTSSDAAAKQRLLRWFGILLSSDRVSFQTTLLLRAFVYRERSGHRTPHSPPPHPHPHSNCTPSTFLPGSDTPKSN